MKFVIQEHWATTHHFDLRLEWDGVLKSWAVPKGVPLSPGIKRLAVQVGDHDLDYADFEGVIEEGMYGAGEVRIWDRGEYEVEKCTDSAIVFTLHGSKAQGKYVLIRFQKAGPRHWLLEKIANKEERS